MKHFRPALLLLVVALFSASAWADGIDPRVIIQKGSGSTPITGTNTMFGPVTATPNSNCLSADPETPDACVFVVFQNQTLQTLPSLTIAINDLLDFSFLCGDLPSDSPFSNCTPSGNNSFFFSGGPGVPAATQVCEEESGCHFVEGTGEFGLLIDATFSENFAGQSVSGNVLTTPEPDAGILMLSAAFAFGLLKLLRRGA